MHWQEHATWFTEDWNSLFFVDYWSLPRIPGFYCSGDAVADCSSNSSRLNFVWEWVSRMPFVHDYRKRFSDVQSSWHLKSLEAMRDVKAFQPILTSSRISCVILALFTFSLLTWCPKPIEMTQSGLTAQQSVVCFRRNSSSQEIISIK